MDERIRPFWPEHARRHYLLPDGSELPYHNFAHALEVTTNALDLVDRCDRYGVPVNETVVVPAALWHDAGYHRPVNGTSKEYFSSTLAVQDLADHPVVRPLLEEVVGTILGTEYDADLRTNEAMVLAAADLRSLASDYETFRENTLRLRDEHALLHGERLTMDEWKEHVTPFIEGFLHRRISLTPVHDGFHRRAYANLDRFLRESF